MKVKALFIAGIIGLGVVSGIILGLTMPRERVRTDGCRQDSKDQPA